MSEYIDHRLAGSNKHDSAVMAGYSESTAKRTNLIESTRAYAVVVNETLHDNSTALRQVVRLINQGVLKDAFAELPVLQQVEIAYKMAKIHDVLTPKITVQETTDKDGNKTRRAWGTAGATFNETPSNDGNHAPWGNSQ